MKYSERDVITKLIIPAIEKAGWDKIHQLREEVPITPGRIQVRGKLHSRGKPRRADLVLYYKPNQPVSVIEAKDSDHQLCDGIQQALAYAEILKVPSV